MSFKFLDKNGKEIKEGMLIRDCEGTYKVIMYDFYGLGNDWCIQSNNNSIWYLGDFASENIEIDVEKLVDFEIVE